MSNPAKILFDECLGKPQVDQIARFVEIDGTSNNQPNLHHILEFHQQGIWDENWVPTIATGEWVVISADRGKKGGFKKGQKLHLLLIEYKITHILLSNQIHQKKWPSKVLAILSVWDEILKIAANPNWSKHQMEPKGKCGAKLVQKKVLDDKGNRIA